MDAPIIPVMGTYQPGGPCSCYAPPLIASDGPVIDNCMCCYGYQSGFYQCGRPFLAGGHSVTAPLAARVDWRDPVEPAQALALDAPTRQAIASGWCEDARMEHASIASFARFTMELLAFGAPSELVEAAQRAGLDEIAHARACFALGSRYGESAVGPGALAIQGAAVRSTLIEATVAAVQEGCVGETVASLLAARQLAVSRDAAVREALSRIAEDEARHAELAYRFVAWAIREGGAPVRDAALRAFSAALDTPPPSTYPVSTPLDIEALHHHGRLTEDEKHALHVEALREVIQPCAAELCEETPWMAWATGGTYVQA